MKRFLVLFLVFALLFTVSCAENASIPEAETPADENITEPSDAADCSIALLDKIHGEKYVFSEEDTAELCRQIALSEEENGWQDGCFPILSPGNRDRLLVTDAEGETVYEFLDVFLNVPAQNKGLLLTESAAKTMNEILTRHRLSSFHYILSDIALGFDRNSDIYVKVPGLQPNYDDWDDAVSKFAQAGKEQRDKIIDCLLCLDGDFTEVEEYDPSQFLFTTSNILVDASGSKTIIGMIGSESDTSTVYVMMLAAQRCDEYLQPRCFKTTSDSFRIRDLNNAVNEVLLEENAAVIWLNDSENPVNKAAATELRYWFDKALRDNGTMEEPAGQLYDVTITAGNTAYALDTGTGIFSRNNTEYEVGCLDEATLRLFLEKYSFYLQ